MKTTDFVLDIETLGTSPGCIVTDIGLVCLGRFQKSMTLDILDQAKSGLTMDPATVAYRFKEGVKTSKVFSNKHGVEIYEEWTAKAALCKLRNILSGYDKSVIWVRGPDFDIPILRTLAKFYNLPDPFPYGKVSIRDIRTAEDIVGPSSIPKTHHALEDAISDAEIVKAFRKIQASPSRV